MINESWALRPDLLTRYAVNSQTGQAIPPALMKAFGAARAYFGSRDVMKIVQNSLWDFAFHKTGTAQFKGSEDVQDKATVNSPYAGHIRPYPLTRFGHLFSGEPSGYAAGYFNYMLADILAKDGATLFEPDAYEPKALERLRTLLRDGSGGDLMKRYIAFKGREATPDAMLRHAGIVPTPKP
jgi:Zn-dependent oligopeptidase